MKRYGTIASRATQRISIAAELCASTGLDYGHLHYRRKVFLYVGQFTFCHLADSFYIKQAAPQQFKQV